MKCLTRSPALKRVMQGLFWQVTTQELRQSRTNCSLIFLGILRQAKSISGLTDQAHLSSSEAPPSVPLWGPPGLNRKVSSGMESLLLGSGNVNGFELILVPVSGPETPEGTLEPFGHDETGVRVSGKSEAQRMELLARLSDRLSGQCSGWSPARP